MIDMTEMKEAGMKRLPGRRKALIVRDPSPCDSAKFMMLKLEDSKGSITHLLVSLPRSITNLHTEIVSRVITKAAAHGTSVTPEGGGRLSIDDKEKTVKAYDSCGKFGPPERVLVEEILRTEFPGHRIIVSIPGHKWAISVPGIRL